MFSSSALDQVQTLAAAVAKATPMDDDDDDYEEEEVKPDRRKKEVSLTAGLDDNVGTSSRAKTVQSALANLERDSTYDKAHIISYIFHGVHENMI